MRATKHIRFLITAAIAAFLSGCLGTDGPEVGSGDMTLNLSVRNTPECAAMQGELTAATGDSAEALLHAFATQCVEEHLGSEPVLTPDPVVRCEWIAVEIDGGHDELTTKYAHYCPEECARMGGENPEAFAKYCQVAPVEDPNPDPVPADTIIGLAIE